MKTCTKCKEDKNIDQFYVNKNGKIKSYCKGCQAIWKRNYYEKNKEKEIKNAVESNKKIKNRNRKYVYEFLLKNPCITCGEADPIALEFDHRDPSIKVIEISKMVCNGVTLKKLQIEIDKCDVLCSNCHKKKTAKQFNWYKDIYLQI